MSWKEVGDERIVIHCVGGHDAEMPPSYAEKILRAHGSYSFGDHVSDPVAVVKRVLHLIGWREVPGKVRTMTCHHHRKEEKDG